MATANSGTFFANLQKSFVDVPFDKSHENAIETSPFLEAAESLCTLFGILGKTLLSPWILLTWCRIDVLGSVAFTPVKSDMLGNVKVGVPHTTTKKPTNGAVLKKIRDRQLVAPVQSEHLQSLVINELKTKKHTATEGLLWLVRFVYLLAHACFQC